MLIEHVDLVYLQLLSVMVLGLSTGFAAEWIKTA